MRQRNSAAENADHAEKPKNISANSAHSAVNLFIYPTGRRQFFAVALFHLAALALTARLAHWPYPLVLLTLALVILPFNFYLRITSYALRDFFSILSSLSPLFFLYTVAALRLLLAVANRALCYTCAAYLAVPEPFATWLSFEWAAIFCLVAIIVLQAAQAFPAQYHSRLAAFALVTLAIVWIAVLYPRLIPAGVTGADPFAYTQMGLDLAARGAPFHDFPLAELARELNIPIYPTLFVGYTIPYNGDSATVWPPGFSALLAIAYKLLGERGLYLLNPLLGGLSAIVTFLLARRVFNLSPFFSAFAAVLLLTSLEQTIRLSIPLADLAAQLFTTLAIIVAFRASSSVGKKRFGFWDFGIWDFLICGLCAGLAFVTRYTQLLIVPGLLLILIHAAVQPEGGLHDPKSVIRITNYGLQITRYALSFLASFFLVSLPDALYRIQAFDSPFSFATGELGQFLAASILPVAIRFFAELAADFNLAFPFVLLGAFYLLKHQRLVALGLAAVLAPVVLFHLPYTYLKLRDLLFLLPTLCALAALGLQHITYRLENIGKFRVCGFANAPHTLNLPHFFQLGVSLIGLPLRVTCYALLFTLIAFRFNAQLPLLQGYYTYGFLTPEGRSHLERIAKLTPPNAVIAASLNSGAVSLYAQRDTFRPGHVLQPGRTWTDAEFLAFVRALQTRQRPLYLLADSEEMADPIRILAGCCNLSPIAELYLPYYYRDGAAPYAVIPFYRIDFR